MRSCLRIAITPLVALAAIVLPAAATARDVDDSYSVAQRFEQYKGRFPQIVWPAVTFIAGQEVLFDRAYKTLPERSLAMDIFLPVAAQRSGTAIMLVHGGAWRSGNKSHFYALASRLAQHGHAVFLPEFRLAPEAAYPAGMIDIADALGWVRENAAQFGVLPNRIAIGGASSGGQMAALLAYAGPTGAFGETGKLPVAGLVDLDGVLDLTDPLALTFENAAGAQSPVARWLGGSYEQLPQVWAGASAARHAGPHSPPTLILGSGIARFTAGRGPLIEALSRNHIHVEVHDLADAPHDFWLFEPWLGPTAERIGRFLDMISGAGHREVRR